MARTNAEAFAALGIPVTSLDRWVTVNTCYSAGWALGRLKFFTAADVVAAYSDGRLQPGDILLTDGVPADTPLVAGIITLSPSTPNSHTAILSQSFGIPFVYLPDADEQTRVLGLVGHKVILRATVTSGVAQIKVLDVEGQLDPALEAQMLALKVPPPINFLPKQSYGAIWTNTDILVPTDIKYFGGKAANYGLLRRWIPTNCPIAIAFSFDLWDAFLDQTLPGGRDAAGDHRRAPGALYELPAGHRLAQDQPCRHPRPFHQDGQFHGPAATGDHQRAGPLVQPAPQHPVPQLDQRRGLGAVHRGWPLRQLQRLPDG